MAKCPKILGAFGNFLSRLSDKLLKKFLKVSAFSLASNETFSFVFKHIFDFEVTFCGKPRDLRIFHNSFGLPTFSSNLFLKIYFLFVFN